MARDDRENQFEAHDDWHAVVRAADEAETYDALRAVAYNVRPRLKDDSDGRRLVPEDASLFQGASECGAEAAGVNWLGFTSVARAGVSTECLKV